MLKFGLRVDLGGTKAQPFGASLSGLMDLGPERPLDVPPIREAIRRGMNAWLLAAEDRALVSLAGAIHGQRSTWHDRRGLPPLLSRMRHSEVRIAGTRLTGSVGNPDFRAHLLERGARPHTIEARRGRFLKFVRSGRLVRVRSVDHPGFPGRFWFARAVAAAEGDLSPMIERELEALAGSTPTVPEGPRG